MTGLRARLVRAVLAAFPVTPGRDVVVAGAIDPSGPAARPVAIGPLRYDASAVAPVALPGVRALPPRRPSPLDYPRDPDGRGGQLSSAQGRPAEVWVTLD
jgi:hypothetical protein